MRVKYQIRTGTWDDEPNVGALMALAFATDPFVRWILPNPHDFVTESLIHAGTTTAPAFDDGTVYMIGEAYGAAVWVGPNAKFKRKDDHANDGRGMPDEFAELVRKSGVYRPAEPHWYLAYIAVDPAHRGKGLGTALMNHSLEICDRDHMPVYLESTNAANLSIYERHGFALLAEVQVGDSPKRYPMLRAAR
ncbi:MAG: GNAT family N-acetyltransferase [Rhodobacteraceae bacterium]|nr:GNAT family N-acetyltransferase [Paracoccaceae bacterium]